MTFYPIFTQSIMTYKTKPFIMYQLTETILPVLFIGLTTYFLGSVIRLFIHLLISEPCK